MKILVFTRFLAFISTLQIGYYFQIQTYLEGKLHVRETARIFCTDPE